MLKAIKMKKKLKRMKTMMMNPLFSFNQGESLFKLIKNFFSYHKLTVKRKTSIFGQSDEPQNLYLIFLLIEIINTYLQSIIKKAQIP